MTEIREEVDRAARGEPITITQAGKAVADVRPVPRPTLTASALVARWRGLPAVDPAGLRAELDEIVDPSPSTAARQRHVRTTR